MAVTTERPKATGERACPLRHYYSKPDVGHQSNALIASLLTLSHT